MNKSKFTYVLKKEDEELRIREILKRRLGFSSRLVRKLKIQGGVELNGAFTKLFEKGRVGDTLTVDLPEETSQFEPEPIPIQVLYEDSDLLLINKQPGFVVHPTKGHANHTIANGLMQYMIDTDQAFKIRFINRLDMDTSGVLLIGKNSHCQDDFTRQASENLVEKKYLAVVHGWPQEEEGTVDEPIGLAQEDQVQRIVRGDGYPSVTHYRVLSRYEAGFSLVELLLETGRTHQIRVHMAHLGHPIVGDVLYGTQEEALIGRQALHARSLSFVHPVKGGPMTAEAPLPEDMLCLLEKLGPEKKE